MKKIALIVILALFSVTAFSQGTIAQWKKLGTKTWFQDAKTYNGFGTVTPTYNWHFIGGVFASTSVTSPLGVFTTATITGVATISGGIVGSAPMRGSAAFTAGQTVVKIHLDGVATTDYIFIQITGTDSTTAVSPNSLCRAYPKTDTIIVRRAAGTTSGLTFDWFRIK